MQTVMRQHIVALREAFAAIWTFVVLGVGVGQRVLVQLRSRLEAQRTIRTLLLANFRVSGLHVHPQ